MQQLRHSLPSIHCSTVITRHCHNLTTLPSDSRHFTHMRHAAECGVKAGSRTALVTRASAWEAVRKGVSPQVLSTFLVLGLPGGVMMAADACSFDVTTVMASILGQPASDTLAWRGRGTRGGRGQRGREGGRGGEGTAGIVCTEWLSGVTNP